MMVGLMMGEHAGTVIEGTVREGIIRPMGTRGAFDIGPVTPPPSSRTGSHGLGEYTSP